MTLIFMGRRGYWILPGSATLALPAVTSPASAPESAPVNPPGASGAGSGVGDGPQVVREGRLSRLALWLPIIGAPLGLLFAILASLAISGWRVTHSAIVQVEQVWQPRESLALRVHVLDGSGEGMASPQVTARLVRGDQVAELGVLQDVGGGATQAGIVVPDWPPGPAQLQLTISPHGPSGLIASREFAEVVDVELAASRAAIKGTLTISTSVKNWADDTEPQPDRLRIALRPLGRLSAGFDNTLLVRVTDPAGVPHQGPIKVRLVDGEWGAHRGGGEPLAVVADGSTDAQGLLRFEGKLATDVIRFDVEVAAPALPVAAPAEVKGKAGKRAAKKTAEVKAAGAEAGAKPADAKTGDAEPADAKAGDVKSSDAKPADAKSGVAKPADTKAAEAGDAEAGVPVSADMPAGTGAPDGPAPLGTRRFRLVSFAGAVKVTAEPLAIASGQPLAIHARVLRAKKPVYIDIHGADGAWVDTLAPVVGAEPPREWSTVALRPGFVQVEAYQFTTSPGESAALARVQVTDGTPDSDESLAPLITLQRAQLELGRTEKGFDRELERAWLDAVEKADIAAADVPLTRAWLLGTLPVEVLGPPLALSTLVREQEALVARKQAWALGLKWFLLGGGGLFLLVVLALVVVSHRRAAAHLSREIHGEGHAAEIAQEIAGAQRAVLLRAVALVVTMGLGLVLTVVVLDKLLWQT